jgi:hypothetical protein
VVVLIWYLKKCAWLNFRLGEEGLCWSVRCAGLHSCSKYSTVKFHPSLIINILWKKYYTKFINWNTYFFSYQFLSLEPNLYEKSTLNTFFHIGQFSNCNRKMLMCVIKAYVKETNLKILSWKLCIYSLF